MGGSVLTWDLTPYRKINLKNHNNQVWRLIESYFGHVYFEGEIDEEGTLVDLPDRFETTYLYDCQMRLQLGCRDGDGNISWPFEPEGGDHSGDCSPYDVATALLMNGEKWDLSYLQGEGIARQGHYWRLVQCNRILWGPPWNDVDSDISSFDSRGSYSGRVLANGVLDGLPKNISAHINYESWHLQICCKNSPRQICMNCKEYFCDGGFSGSFASIPELISGNNLTFIDEQAVKNLENWYPEKWYKIEEVYVEYDFEFAFAYGPYHHITGTYKLKNKTFSKYADLASIYYFFHYGEGFEIVYHDGTPKDFFEIPTIGAYTFQYGHHRLCVSIVCRS
jgi:hypothetical protein